MPATYFYGLPLSQARDIAARVVRDVDAAGGAAGPVERAGQDVLRAALHTEFANRSRDDIRSFTTGVVATSHAIAAAEKRHSKQEQKGVATVTDSHLEAGLIIRLNGSPDSDLARREALERRGHVGVYKPGKPFAPMPLPTDASLRQQALLVRDNEEAAYDHWQDLRRQL